MIKIKLISMELEKLFSGRSIAKGTLAGMLCIFGFVGINAKPVKVSGIVVSSYENEPLMGAVVGVVNDKDNRVLTDENGHYVIDVEPGSKLKFTYLAHHPKVVKVKSDTLNVTLDEIEEIFNQIITTD
jgi:hypothetical protein